MYKFLAEKTDQNGIVTDARTYTASSFTSAIHPAQESGDVTIDMDSGLHTVIEVGGKPSEWQYVRVFNASGVQIESMTYAGGRVYQSGRHTGDRP